MKFWKFVFELEIFGKIEFEMNVLQNFENISKFQKISKIFQNFQNILKFQKIWFFKRLDIGVLFLEQFFVYSTEVCQKVSYVFTNMLHNRILLFI